jgi:hypothetical protein
MRIIRFENMDEVLVSVPCDPKLNDGALETLKIIHPSELEGCEVIPPQELDPEIVKELEAYETPLPKKPTPPKRRRIPKPGTEITHKWA